MSMFTSLLNSVHVCMVEHMTLYCKVDFLLLYAVSVMGLLWLVKMLYVKIECRCTVKCHYRRIKRILCGFCNLKVTVFWYFYISVVDTV